MIKIIFSGLIVTFIAFNGAQATLQQYIKNESDDKALSPDQGPPKRSRLVEGLTTAEVLAVSFLDNLPEPALTQVLKALDSFSGKDIKSLRHVSQALNHQVVPLLFYCEIFYNSHFNKEFKWHIFFNSDQSRFSSKQMIQYCINSYKSCLPRSVHVLPTLKDFILFLKNAHSMDIKIVSESLRKCVFEFSFLFDRPPSFSEYESYVEQWFNDDVNNNEYRFSYFLNLSSPFARFIQKKTTLHIPWIFFPFFLSQDFSPLKGISAEILNLNDTLFIPREALGKITKLTVKSCGNFKKLKEDFDYIKFLNCNQSNTANFSTNDHIEEFIEESKLELPALQHLIINENGLLILREMIAEGSLLRVFQNLRSLTLLVSREGLNTKTPPKTSSKTPPKTLKFFLEILTNLKLLPVNGLSNIESLKIVYEDKIEFEKRLNHRKTKKPIAENELEFFTSIINSMPNIKKLRIKGELSPVFQLLGNQPLQYLKKMVYEEPFFDTNHSVTYFINRHPTLTNFKCSSGLFLQLQHPERGNYRVNAQRQHPIDFVLLVEHFFLSFFGHNVMDSYFFQYIIKNFTKELIKKIKIKYEIVQYEIVKKDVITWYQKDQQLPQDQRIFFPMNSSDNYLTTKGGIQIFYSNPRKCFLNLRNI